MTLDEAFEYATTLVMIANGGVRCPGTGNFELEIYCTTDSPNDDILYEVIW